MSVGGRVRHTKITVVPQLLLVLLVVSWTGITPTTVAAFVVPTQQHVVTRKPLSPCHFLPAAKQPWCSFQFQNQALFAGPQNDGSGSAVEDILNLDSLPIPRLEGESVELISTGVTRLAQVLNDSTDGWALSYADLSPETEETPLGMSFLATNLAYGTAGLLLAAQGDFFYGALTDMAALVSFWYHYNQLKLGQTQPSTVRLALLIDYIVAAATILTTIAYLASGQTISEIPMDGIVAGALGTVCLGLCWVWEYGYPYIVLHSLWHLGSAYAGYIVGQTHLSSGM